MPLFFSKVLFYSSPWFFYELCLIFILTQQHFFKSVFLSYSVDCPFTNNVPEMWKSILSGSDIRSWRVLMSFNCVTHSPYHNCRGMVTIATNNNIPVKGFNFHNFGITYLKILLINWFSTLFWFPAYICLQH